MFIKKGLALINIDYDVIHDSLTGKTEFVFKTFSRNDLVDIRYYTDIEPTPAPPSLGFPNLKDQPCMLSRTYIEHHRL